MKRFLTGAGRAVGPDGLASTWKWLIAGALAFGIAPVSVPAQDMTEAMRSGRFSQPHPSVVAASTSTNPHAMNPYRYGDSYAPDSSLMNSGTSGAFARWEGQGYGGTGYGQPGTGQTAPLAAATLFGLPAEKGRVKWPFALQVLQPAEETRALREQLELVLYFVATQAAEGRVNRVFIDFGLEAVRDLRQHLKSRQAALPAFSYTEAMQFLDRAERGLTKIKMMDTGPGGAYP